jgi:hypothetical protein
LSFFSALPPHDLFPCSSSVLTPTPPLLFLSFALLHQVSIVGHGEREIDSTKSKSGQKIEICDHYVGYFSGSKAIASDAHTPPHAHICRIQTTSFKKWWCSVSSFREQFRKIISGEIRSE